MIKLFNKIISALASLPMAFSPLCLSASAEEIDPLKSAFMPLMTSVTPYPYTDYPFRWNIPRLSGENNGTVTMQEFMNENNGAYPYVNNVNGISYPLISSWFVEKYNVDTTDAFAQSWSLDLPPITLGSRRIEDNTASPYYGAPARPLPRDRITRNTINIVIEYTDGSDPDRDFGATALLLETWVDEYERGDDIIIAYDSETNSYHMTRDTPFTIAFVAFPFSLSIGEDDGLVPYFDGLKYPLLHFYEEYYDPVARAFSRGYEQGYTDGYANGTERVEGNTLKSLVVSVFTAPINALYTALDVDILGYNLGNVFRGIIAGVAVFAVVAVVIKYKVG